MWLVSSKNGVNNSTHPLQSDDVLERVLNIQYDLTVFGNQQGYQQEPFSFLLLLQPVVLHDTKSKELFPF